MRFIILLVAGAYAAADCKSATATPLADQNTCHTSATVVTPVACDADNCAFGTGNEGNQWAETYDVVAEACRATPFVKADCDKCVAALNCDVDFGVAKTAAEAATGYTAPTTCKGAVDAGAALGATLPACVATAAWMVAPTCAADDGAVDTVDWTAKAYGATDTTCTAAIYNGCMVSVGCADFQTEYAGKVAAATTAAPDSTKGSDTSPAAMISAGIALVALLF
jgi:hypothetical protein